MNWVLCLCVFSAVFFGQKNYTMRRNCLQAFLLLRRGGLVIKAVAGLEAVVSRMVKEEAIVIGALPIFEAFEVDLARLLSLGVFDTFARLGNVIVAFEVVHNVKLESPNNVGGVFNVARLFEALEGNGMRVIRAVETAYDEEGGVGVALKFLKLADSIVDTELS